ncbi:putative cobaltochelatase [Desulfolithobacter sp.]
MTIHDTVYPFSAIVGQEQLKLALLLNVINPRIGGVLIRGEKGTAKSTAVRALAALLPEIDVVKGSPLGCGPDEQDERCSICLLCSSPPHHVQRRVPVVTLPLNATEDCLVGGIDFDQAIRSGRRLLQPGLLARVHRGILYVDEVNLLDDHLVDVILDAAASGENHIEREGISFVHPTHFVLVGTMNPEEGELRPQLLDRFGLCIKVKASADKDSRVLTMMRREAYDADPIAFNRRFEEENRAVARRIIQAREMLAGVSMPGHLRPLIAELCTENSVAGHRADLVIEQAARALAAYREQPEVTVEEIREVAAMALLHRKRESAPPPPPEHDHDHDHRDPPGNNQEETREDKGHQQEEQPRDGQHSQPEDLNTAAEDEMAAESHQEEKERHQREDEQDVQEQIFDVGNTFRVRKFTAPKDRIFRRGSGRRSRSRISRKQGRYVKSVVGRNTDDVALDATLRAAAPYQLRRKNGNGLAVVLRPEDIRGKIREKRIGNFLLFVVDASGSMGARGRMVATKGAVMSLLLDAYQKRDRVAMISFRKDEAVVNLPPTSSVELAASLLREMPVGGRTPLSAALAKSYEILRNYLVREPAARPIAIVITDGKSNTSLGKKKPLDEAFAFAERIAMDERIRCIVVDTEVKGLITFSLAQKLADAMNARYFKIEDLKADTLLNIVQGDA